MTTWRYRFAGLLFESALHLPEWDAFSSSEVDQDPDVRIILDGEAQAGPAADDGRLVRPDEYAFFVRNVGRYQVLDGRRIVVAREPDARSGELRLFLLGSALAAVCCQRGLLLLHASVVRLAARTVALCGPVGSGKSALAAALIGYGASFVCDDLGRFDASDGSATVYPSTPRIKLRPETLASLAWPSDGLERVHARATKFYVPQVHCDPWSPIPLHAIFVLEWSDGPVRATALTGVSALRALVAAATYRPGFLEPMGQLAAHWQRCAALAAGAKVYRLTRPRVWSAMGEAVEIIAGSSC